MKARRLLPFVAGAWLHLVLTALHCEAVLHDGEMLSPTNWQEAKGLLPDEILDHYRNGDYANRIMEFSAPAREAVLLPPDLLAASRANRGRYAVTPAGSLVDAQTGTQPEHVMGVPFEIDAADPQAGSKVVWNYFYSTWYRGDCHFLMELLMLGRRGVERRIVVDMQMRLYDGAPDAPGRTNPDNLQLQSLVSVVAPVDLNGTVSLTWRFRDPDHHDTLWTYVPGLRRPRQVSPLNRSDGFMGSDVSLDDGPFFDGKLEDFTFRLLGRQEQFILMDPYSLRGEGELLGLPAGGWRILWKDVPRIGNDDPSWKGVPWAPVSAVLVRRPVWIVEAVPKDPNYLYGRLVLRFDAETYLGTWASKYDRAGAPVASYQVLQGAYLSPDGGRTYVPGAAIGFQIAENLVYKRATVALFPARNRENPADYRVPLPRDLFNPDVLVRFGR